MGDLAIKFNFNKRYSNHDEYFSKHPLEETFGYIYLWALQLDIFRKYCKEWYLSGNYNTRTIDGMECAIIYVGQSVSTNVLARERQHITSSEQEFDQFIDEIANEYNIDEVMPRIIIDHANDMKILNLKEEYYIMRYNLFYNNNEHALNHQRGGNSHNSSKKSREKMSKAKKGKKRPEISGEKHPHYGRTGKKHPMYGKKRQDLIGKNNPKFKGYIKAINKETGELVFVGKSTYDIERKVKSVEGKKLIQSGISAVLNNRQKQHGGYFFEYCPEEEYLQWKECNE